MGSGMSSGVSLTAYPIIMPLVAGPGLPVCAVFTADFQSRAHSRGDVGRLLVDRHEDAAGIPIKPVRPVLS